MKPEERARVQIDTQLTACGWVVQDRAEMNISAGRGVAVREFPLKSGPVDYLLYADGKAIGVVEAKPEGHSLTGVEIQSALYAEGVVEEVELGSDEPTNAQAGSFGPTPKGTLRSAVNP